MLDKRTDDTPGRQPSGFTQHSGGLASEYAREQGWGINEEERAKEAQEKQDSDGGTDYDQGAKDFGDSAVNTSTAQPVANGGKRIISIPVQSVPKHILAPSKRHR